MTIRTALKPVISKALLSMLRVTTSYSQPTLDKLQHQVIVCANHVSLIDGVIVALASPVPLAFGVDTAFSRYSKVALTGLKVLAWLGFGSVVPIDSNSPFGIRSLSVALKHGQSIMLFPEGRISDTGAGGPDQPGVHWLMAKHPQAALVRVQIHGAEQSQLFAKAGKKLWPPIHISF
ncbi:1-acyl-sn-glycerol-3-phosphate acyltransferase [Comamonas testosteroni]|jgi:1-acyl-sn-glycerol-3-phosphate acyltransferase|uniref:1-acyl-sn-glycerol-3-phosphate acyltransferase n=1 Tax=Comamonas testosteroni TaxID=285 RepID=UPI0026F07553|nr:1-acyl-sn-glycerol-3-phosphate acyltransferase [Comamonas testosteroni]